MTHTLSRRLRIVARAMNSRGDPVRNAGIGGAALVFLLVTACGSDSTDSLPTTTSSVPTPTTTSAPISVPTPPPPAPLITNTPPAAALPPTAVKAPLARPVACTVRDLDVSLGGSEGAAGTMYRALVFTNTGGRTCTIQGFPGVSFVAGDEGRQVGEAAVRAGEKGPLVTLKPGGIASSTVGFVNIGAFDEAACQPTAVRGLRVYPPHERKSTFVPFETTGCAGKPLSNQLTVRTVHGGTDLG